MDGRKLVLKEFGVEDTEKKKRGEKEAEIEVIMMLNSKDLERILKEELDLLV